MTLARHTVNFGLSSFIPLHNLSTQPLALSEYASPAIDELSFVFSMILVMCGDQADSDKQHLFRSSEDGVHKHQSDDSITLRPRYPFLDWLSINFSGRHQYRTEGMDSHKCQAKDSHRCYITNHSRISHYGDEI